MYYPYKLESKSSHFSFGICTKETNLGANVSFGCDNMRLGYFCSATSVIITTKGTSKSTDSKKLSQGDCLVIFVHCGSYSSGGSVLVSFFHLDHENNFEYQFTVKNFPLSSDGKIYAFFGCSSPDVHVRALRIINRNPEKDYLPIYYDFKDI